MEDNFKLKSTAGNPCELVPLYGCNLKRFYGKSTKETKFVGEIYGEIKFLGETVQANQ